MFREEALARSEALAITLEDAHVEDFRVDNDEGRNITEVAREVLSRAGWLPPLGVANAPVINSCHGN